MGMLRLALALLVTGCAAHRVDLLVIAPHPDDEALLAAGAMAKARAAGKSVSVIVVTNGDFTCERDGYLREAESVRALAKLDVKDVHFLGYPDGALARMGHQPLDPIEHRDANGECTARTGTYADRSEGRLDEHTARTGQPGEWTSDSLLGDLEALLDRLRPRTILLPHFIDDHPDHAATYRYVRRALENLHREPEVLRGVVHSGACWPSDCKTFLNLLQPMPPLPRPLGGYAPTRREPIDADQKLDVISTYISQAGADPETDWLSSFARADEIFWPEDLEQFDEEQTLLLPAVWRGYALSPTGVTTPEGKTLRSWDETKHLTLRVRHVGAYDEVLAWGDEGFVAGWVRLATPAKP